MSSEMASALSVDAQEFVPGPGHGLVVGSKTKLGSSLSVDAPVFVPVPLVQPQVEQENSTTAHGKQENKTAVQRRGRFAQIDSRAQQCSSQKNVDLFPSNKDNKNDNNVGKVARVQSNGDCIEKKVTKETDKNKLQQSFSLEYAKRRKQASFELDEKVINDKGIESSKTPQNLTFSSGESKPIILWSSIVKQEAISEKRGSTINHEKSFKSNTVPPDEKATRKYSKNKVTRTKNVLSEPTNEKYHQRSLGEKKRKEYSKDDDLLHLANKSISSIGSFGIKDTLNCEPEKNLLPEAVVSNNSIHRSPYVIKNSKRRSKDKDISDINVDDKKLICKNLVDESSKKNLRKTMSGEVSCMKTQKLNETRRNMTRQFNDLSHKGNDRNIIVKKKNSSEKILDGDDNIPKKLKNAQPAKQSFDNIFPEKTKVETVDLNLSDNSTFPALSGGRVSMSVKTPLSYSAVAKRVLTVNKTPLPSTSNAEKNMLDAINNMQLSEEEKRALKKRQKALKRKMKVKQKKQEAKMGQPKEEVTEKVSNKEITFDLSEMFTKLLKIPIVEKKSQRSVKAKKLKMSTGVISVVSGLAKKNTPDGRRVERNKYGTTHTIMDGSTIRKRGKERETPKKKRPTLLKKVITAERERKRTLLANKISDVENKELPVENIIEIEKPVEKAEQISEFPEDIWKKIHSKKFREYCDHVLTKDINHLTYNLLVTLQKFQDRVYHENPTKYRQKRRFILGLREVLKHLKLKRLKAVIIAPNIERISSKGGLDDYLGSIISICNEQNLPKIFAMNRHVLGRVIKKLAPVSVVGIFDYDGAHEIFKELLNNVQLAKETYREKVNSLTEDNKNVENDSSHPSADILSSSMDNVAQLGDGLKHRMLNKLYLNEYQTYDPGSESDAWVTDNESSI